MHGVITPEVIMQVSSKFIVAALVIGFVLFMVYETLLTVLSF